VIEIRRLSTVKEGQNEAGQRDSTGGRGECCALSRNVRDQTNNDRFIRNQINTDAICGLARLFHDF
jgi:hypothetical protein